MAQGDSDQLVLDFSPDFRIFKDGRIERYVFLETVPPCTDPESNVQSKDVTISQETGVAARLFLPKTATEGGQKLPLLIYIHGGAFCLGSPSTPVYHNHVTTLAAQANAVAVSIHYRLAPEHPLPTAFDDSWLALQWIATHSDGNGPDAWLNEYTDLGRVFIAGESAGATLSHNMAMRIGLEGLPRFNLVGLVLVCPFFGDGKPFQLIDVVYPTSTGPDDPIINAAKDSNLARLRCSKVLIAITGKDFLRERGCGYYEALKKSGWPGELQFIEIEGEGHSFHLFYPDKEKAISLVQKIASFVNQH